jgi:hypothetical protein
MFAPGVLKNGLDYLETGSFPKGFVRGIAP